MGYRLLLYYLLYVAGAPYHARVDDRFAEHLGVVVYEADELEPLHVHIYGRADLPGKVPSPYNDDVLYRGLAALVQAEDLSPGDYHERYQENVGEEHAPPDLELREQV